MKLNQLFPVLLTASLAGLSACGGGGTTDSGTPPLPTMSCATTTPGSVTITYNNMYVTSPKINIAGPNGYTNAVTSTTTLTNLEPGAYTFASTPTASSGTKAGIARGAYNATLSSTELCIGDNTNATLSATVAVIPTSAKLWAGTTQSQVTLLGYNGPDIALSSAKVSAAVTASIAGSGGAIFDKSGNVWTLGTETLDPLVLRYSASEITSTTSISKTANFTIPQSAAGNCNASGLAFDASGNLWVASHCTDAIYRFSAKSDGTVETSPSITISNLPGLSSIAFDAFSNLWASAYVDNTPFVNQVVRFDNSRLASNISTAPDDILHVVDNPSITDVQASAIAFDKSGNLWVMHNATTQIFRVNHADLYSSTTGTTSRIVNPDTHVGDTTSAALGVSFAIDESGNIWVSGDGYIDDYDTSTNKVIAEIQSANTSSELAYGSGISFYPGPKGLPLYSSLP